MQPIDFARFNSKIELIPFSACWYWVGVMRGYPALHFGKRLKSAHRLSYEHFKGPIPQGLLVRHTCDEPYCVNPAHLLTGTQYENMMDKVSRGRQQKGEQIACAKLTADQVLQIREKYKYRSAEFGVKSLAKEYGTSVAAIYSAISGETWSSDGYRKLPKDHKFCPKCETAKPFSEFAMGASTDGPMKLKRICKSCSDSRIASWREKNRDRCREYGRRSREKKKSEVIPARRRLDLDGMPICREHTESEAEHV